MDITSETTMAKMFIAPLVEDYTFQGVVNKISDPRYDDEHIENEETNVSDVFDFINNHENARFVYNFIQENKDEIIEKIFYSDEYEKYSCDKPYDDENLIHIKNDKLMKFIRDFWYKNFTYHLGLDEFDMWNFLHIHIPHDEYFESVMIHRIECFNAHNREFNKDEIWNVEKVVKSMMDEFTKEQICKLIPGSSTGFQIHLREDEIDCEVNETFEDVMFRLDNFNYKTNNLLYKRKFLVIHLKNIMNFYLK